MKHLLRKLHIGGGGGGGGVDHQHHQRLGDPRRNPSPPPAASASSSSRGSGQEAASAGPDFRLFEEEYQVQLALAISASDPDGLEDPDSVQMKAAKRMSLGCSLGVGTAAADSVGVGGADESSMEFLSLRYRVSLEVFPVCHCLFYAIVLIPCLWYFKLNYFLNTLQDRISILKGLKRKLSIQSSKATLEASYSRQCNFRIMASAII